MAKRKCPQCRARFDYEECGWICPECGWVVTGSEDPEPSFEGFRSVQEEQTPSDTQTLEQKRQQMQKRLQEAQKSASQTINQADVAVVKGAISKLFRWVMIVSLATLVFLLGIGVAIEFQEVAPYLDKEQVQIVHRSAEMNDLLPVNSDFTLCVTQAYEGEWDGIESPDGGRYIAVRYEVAGDSEDGTWLSDVAWACLYDATADAYLTQLFTSDIAGEDDALMQMLYENGVGYSLNENGGVAVFLAQEELHDYELYLVCGKSDGYGFDTFVTEQTYRIPLTLTEQEDAS